MAVVDSIMNSAEKLLEKLGSPSLTELADIIPTTLTADAYILKAISELTDPLNAFHHLSLSHSTLLYHRLAQKLIRRNSHDSVEGVRKSANHSQNMKYTQLSTMAILRPTCSDDTKSLLQLLPSDWTAVQVTNESRISEGEKCWNKVNSPLHTPAVYISRCKCGVSPSVIIKKIHPPKEENAVRSILQEMELIKGENKVISKNYRNDQEKYLSKREELNNRLRVLVKSMEIAWLRHWSCLFVGALQPEKERIVINMVKEAAQKSKISLTDEQLAILSLMVSIQSPSKSDGDVLPYEFPVRVGIAAVLNESVRSDAIKAFTKFIVASHEKLKDAKSSARGPVILILDKNIVALPWEMMSVLQNQPVTRMPSFQSLVLLYLYHTQKEDSVLVNGVNIQDGYFVLDPEDNLPRSRERLKDSFSVTNWSGISAQKPTHDQFREAVSTKDIFVYVGHGSGSQYMPAQLVETVECRAMVLLYGCSSTSLAKRGSIPDPWGVVLNYLIASCPCVVGMLWEVMDKDTDLLTKEMIRAMRGIPGPPGSPLEDPPTDIALLVAKARPLCSWYLISSALSVYGLPLQIAPGSQ